MSTPDRAGRRLLAQLRPFRRRMAGVALLGLLAVGCAVTIPIVLAAVTDHIVTGATGAATVDWPGLTALLGVALGLYVLSAVFNVLQGRLVATIVQGAAHRLRAQVQAKLTRLPLSSLDAQRRGSVVSRVTNDMDSLVISMQLSANQIVTAVLTVVGVAAAMLSWSVWLTLVTVVMVPVSTLIVWFVSRRNKKHFAVQRTALGDLTAIVEEQYSAHVVVRAFHGFDRAAGAFARENDRFYESSLRSQFGSAIVQPAMLFVSNLTFVAVAVVGGLLVAGGSLTIGGIQAFIQYSRQFSDPLSQIAGLVSIGQSGLASARRVFELLDEPEQGIDPVPSDAAARPVRGLVAFEHVHFGYSPDRPVLEDFCLTVEPGRMVAIVGPTGAGKTTLVSLLMRFYEPDGGRITLDGVDIAARPRDEVRGRIAMVLQDTWIFRGTIAENIAYGSPGASRADVVAAARSAHAHAYIRSLPDGYDTIIDNDGTAVSAGERQLITIARAVLADRPILVLDEATSSVDTYTEALVQRGTAFLRRDRTSFVIAHRLSTIRDADVIVVMDGGRIVEQGRHDELLERSGTYADLYAAQFAAAV
jgi:ATP-binding cassette, subfamily B, multidrug efflux pump